VDQNERSLLHLASLWLPTLYLQYMAKNLAVMQRSDGWNDTVDKGAGDLVMAGGMTQHFKLTADVFENADERRTKNVATSMVSIGAPASLYVVGWTSQCRDRVRPKELSDRNQ